MVGYDLRDIGLELRYLLCLRIVPGDLLGDLGFERRYLLRLYCENVLEIVLDGNRPFIILL